MGKVKYALLDTDFISKTHLIRKDDNNKLIDQIVQMPEYKFYCHEQIKTELLRHNIAGSPEWLLENVSNGKIICYDDRRIILELEEIYGDSAPAVYAQMLKTSCEAYRRGYFEEQFAKISQLDYTSISRDYFLTVLDQECDDLGADHNIGELKSYVLLQFLCLMLGQQIYVFCSDDRNARNGIISIGNARCISVLSSFLRLKKECGFDKNEAEPYVEAYINFLKNRNQTAFRIQNGPKASQIVRVPCGQVFEEIYSGKLEELKNGNLKYI